MALKKDEDLIKEIGDVRFAVLLLKSCNGAESNSFTSAKCEFEMYEENEPSYVSFEQIFVDGISFLKEEKGDENILNAFMRLNNFREIQGETIHSFPKYYQGYLYSAEYLFLSLSLFLLIVYYSSS